MKTKTGFELRNLCGEKIIVVEEQAGVDLSCVIHMNESAAFLWEALAGREFTESDMAELLCREYKIGESEVAADCRKLIAGWQEAGLLES